MVAGKNHWPLVTALRVLSTLEYKFKVSLLHGYFYPCISWIYQVDVLKMPTQISGTVNSNHLCFKNRSTIYVQNSRAFGKGTCKDHSFVTYQECTSLGFPGKSTMYQVPKLCLCSYQNLCMRNLQPVLSCVQTGHEGWALFCVYHPTKSMATVITKFNQQIS